MGCGIRGGELAFNGVRPSVFQNEEVGECGDSCMTMWMHLMLPNCMLTHDYNGEFSVRYKHSRLTGGEGDDRG